MEPRKTPPSDLTKAVFPPPVPNKGERPIQNPKRDSFLTIASELRIDVWDLIEFNFPGSRRKPDVVNWYLYNKMGARQTTQDGLNYIFPANAKVYYPKQGPSPLPVSGTPADPDLAPTPLFKRDVALCIDVIASDPAARETIMSVLPLLGPLLPAGATRNILIGFVESFGSAWKSVHEPSGRYIEDAASDLAWKYACTGIADAASTALSRKLTSVPYLRSAESYDRRGTIAHTAVKIVMERPRCAPTPYVLDWWRTLVVWNPKIFMEPEFHSGNPLAGREYVFFRGYNIPE